MKYTNPRLDLVLVHRATSRALSYCTTLVAKIKNYTEDSDRVARLKECLCPYCKYIGTDRIGGAAMTTANCACCDKSLLFGNTNVDLLCPDCAKHHRLCKHCGADLDLKRRRKLNLPEKPAADTVPGTPVKNTWIILPKKDS